MSVNHKLAALCAVAALAESASLQALPTPVAETVTTAAATAQPLGPVKEVKRLNPTAVEIIFENGRKMTADFYYADIVRLFLDPNGGIVRKPKAEPEADILVPNARSFQKFDLKIVPGNGETTIATDRMNLTVAHADGSIKITDLDSGETVMETKGTPRFADGKVMLDLVERPDEYFFGGGVQNGRFSHKGKKINIVNENAWTDGGVCSPAPFYWTTAGYGILWHTFAPGKYDFGATAPGTVSLTHDTDYFDIFVMDNKAPMFDLPYPLVKYYPPLLRYYLITGFPALLPKFGFYEGHLNAYNRDYWTPDSTPRAKVTLFEDGKHYKESQKDNGGIRESLNGELPGNYQFSARAVVDRYLNADMPLGWVLPNDGYGAGYGQTSSLDGNVENLRQFGDYARSKGVEIGLWTQSDLHPKEGIEPLLQRDIVKEVRDAGVRVLKTDVAWVGYGYSFGLNGVADVAQIMPYYGNDARPFIISLDGWAGTQRYAGVWSGDQTGGEWEYIRFHIPTYIGAGLSGMPNITSDMDGIFGGNKPIINTRDFQWKTFTPMQLNMDGWGYAPKYPQAMGEPYTSINRHYLKLKSELMPYAYTYAQEASSAKPLVRGMMVDYPSPYTYSDATRYQFLYGPDFLVAPIYQATAPDSIGNDIRHGIYLPEGEWVDYFNGDVYQGNRIINYFNAPLWKLPVFVRRGAIIPMNNPHNNPAGVDRTLRLFELYPAPGVQMMMAYDDDGTTQAYLDKKATNNFVETTLKNEQLKIKVGVLIGKFSSMVPEQRTVLRINASAIPKKVTAKLAGKKLKLTYSDVPTDAPLTWYYDSAPELNRFATPGSEFANVKITKNPQIVVNLGTTDVTKNMYEVDVTGYTFDTSNRQLVTSGSIAAPDAASVEIGVKPYSIFPHWVKPAGADYCEIEFNGQTLSTLTGDSILIEDLKPATRYDFRLRGVNASGPGPWTELSATTADNPLEFAITGLKGRSSQPAQDGFELDKLFDFSETNMLWHTEYQEIGIPCQLTIDLGSVNRLDRAQYLAPTNLAHGTILEGNASYSFDGNTWSDSIPFTWTRDHADHTVAFPNSPEARYVRLNFTKGVGNYAAGREVYVFRTPGSESWIQGDINKDGKLDDNDLTSYMNYTGLRRGDADFDYVAIGDVNRNGLIDAYDISLVATTLDGGVQLPTDSIYNLPVRGTLTLSGAPTRPVAPGDEITLTLTGTDLSNVNALSLALPYNSADWEFVRVTPLAPLASMTNLTYDRLHTSGEKVLYPTFVNRGNLATLSGTEPLLTITLRARRRATFTPRLTSPLLVGPNLRTAP